MTNVMEWIKTHKAISITAAALMMVVIFAVILSIILTGCEGTEPADPVDTPPVITTVVTTTEADSTATSAEEAATTAQEDVAGATVTTTKADGVTTTKGTTATVTTTKVTPTTKPTPKPTTAATKAPTAKVTTAKVTTTKAATTAKVVTTTKATTTVATTVHVPITPAQAEAYANEYLQSLGFSIDYSFTPSNSGYLTPRVLHRGMSYDESTKSVIRQGIDWSVNRLAGYDGYSFSDYCALGGAFRAYAEATPEGGVYLYILY